MLTGFLYSQSANYQLNQLIQAGRAAGERVFESMTNQRNRSAGEFEKGVRGELYFEMSVLPGLGVAGAEQCLISRAPGRNYRVGRQNWCRKIYSDQFADAFL